MAETLSENSMPIVDQLRQLGVLADAVMVIDMADNGRIVYWNEGAQAYLGYTPNDILGNPITSILPEEEHLLAMAAMSRQLDDPDQDRFYQAEYPAAINGISKTGTIVPVNVRMSTIGSNLIVWVDQVTVSGQEQRLSRVGALAMELAQLKEEVRVLKLLVRRPPDPGAEPHTTPVAWNFLTKRIGRNSLRTMGYGETEDHTGVPMAHEGEVVAMAMFIDAPFERGQVTFWPMINDQERQDLAQDITDTTNRHISVDLSPGTLPFAARDRLSVRYHAQGFSARDAEAGCTLWVQTARTEENHGASLTTATNQLQ